jgi:hypothetical protein
MRPSNPVIINALSATSSQNSVVLNASSIVAASFQIVSSSVSNAGSLQVEFSNDPVAGLSVDASGNPIPVNWSNLGTAATVTSGAVASVQVPQSSYAGYRWLRAVWTPNSGAGTITVNAFTIGI